MLLKAVVLFALLAATTPLNPDVTRRSFVVSPFLIASSSSSSASTPLRVVTDPATYSALVYEPQLNDPRANEPQANEPRATATLPLLVVLPGAGKNKGGIEQDMASMFGEQSGLPASLLSAGKAPESLSRDFVVVQPYPAGLESFYEEPRGKLLSWLDWFCGDAGREAGAPRVDKARIVLFGFSDGATCAVELATTGRFASCVVVAPGLTGSLPPRALKLLKTQPFYFAHAVDDEVFPISGTDRLVDSLCATGNSRITYSRLESGGHRGAAIAASSRPEIYEWLKTAI